MSVPLQAPVLYNGCRTGEIFSIDLRQRARRGHGWKGVRFYQDSAITSVRILQDDNYLIAADMLGKVRPFQKGPLHTWQKYSKEVGDTFNVCTQAAGLF